MKKLRRLLTKSRVNAHRPPKAARLRPCERRSLAAASLGFLAASYVALLTRIIVWRLVENSRASAATVSPAANRLSTARRCSPDNDDGRPNSLPSAFARCNPDFVRYAESYGAKGSRVTSVDGLLPTLEAAFKGGGVHLVDVPIDYSENTRVLVNELRDRKLGVEPA